jgi:hypothetical protein
MTRGKPAAVCFPSCSQFSANDSRLFESFDKFFICGGVHFLFCHGKQRLTNCVPESHSFSRRKLMT